MSIRSSSSFRIKSWILNAIYSPIEFMKTIFRKKVLLKLTVSALMLFQLAACSAVDKKIGNSTPPEKRVFAEKPFAPDAWIKGDAQTRGEMTPDLLKYETAKSLKGKNQSELIKLLGEPDKKTMGKYGHVRFGDEVEVWLYKIETADEPGRKTKRDSVQVFFSAEDKTVVDLFVGAMDEKPAYFPMVG